MIQINDYISGLLFSSSAAVSVQLQSLEETQKIVGVAQSLFTIAAIIIGAIWTYFNFFRGRTYRMRLEPEVSGRMIQISSLNHLVVTIRLKNVGLSKVEIEQDGSALVLYSYSAPVGAREILSAAWESLTAFPVFESHGWIEPNEEIEEQRLIIVPVSGHTIFQLQLRIVSNKIEWKAMDTVLPTLVNDENEE